MKIVYYTCSTGPEDGFVPSIKEQLPENLEAFYLHDGHIDVEQDKGWSYINLQDVSGCPATSFPLRQRFGKMLPHLFFPDADYTIYLDQKYYLHRSFFETLLNLIEENPSKHFLVPKHPDNRTFFEELLFPFTTGMFSYDYTREVANRFHQAGANPENFISTLACLLVRKNSPEIIEANTRWYDLTKGLYGEGPLRDQLTLPYSGVPLSLVENYLEIQQETGTLLYYPTTSRHCGQPDIDKKSDLLNELKSLWCRVS